MINFIDRIVIWFLLVTPNTILRKLVKVLRRKPKAHCIIKSLVYTKSQYRSLNWKLDFSLQLRSDIKPKSIVFIDNCYGGITDCFKSMISLFDFCCKNNYSFKIYKKKTFDFERFFCPSGYDWHLSDDDYNVLSSKRALHLWLSNDETYHSNTWQYQQHTLRFLFNSNFFNHILVHYSAPHSLSSKSFKTLFSPSIILGKELEYHKNKLGDDYISVSFRFVNLLGDSNEIVCGYKSLDLEEQQGLIDANLSVLKKLIGMNSNKKFLVTSDSFRFISAVEGALLDNVYFIKGSEVHHHIAFSDNVSDKEVTKSYVEFMLISESVVAYQIQIGPMYESKFPKWAACVNNVPYYLIRLSDIGDIDSDLTPISVSYY